MLDLGGIPLVLSQCQVNWTVALWFVALDAHLQMSRLHWHLHSQHRIAPAICRWMTLAQWFGNGRYGEFETCARAMRLCNKRLWTSSHYHQS